MIKRTSLVSCWKHIAISPFLPLFFTPFVCVLVFLFFLPSIKRKKEESSIRQQLAKPNLPIPLLSIIISTTMADKKSDSVAIPSKVVPQSTNLSASPSRNAKHGGFDRHSGISKSPKKGAYVFKSMCIRLLTNFRCFILCAHKNRFFLSTFMSIRHYWVVCGKHVYVPPCILCVYGQWQVEQERVDGGLSWTI